MYPPPPEIVKPRRINRYETLAGLLRLTLSEAQSVADGESPPGFGLAAIGLS